LAQQGQLAQMALSARQVRLVAVAVAAMVLVQTFI
jgi:hypothetical protein